MRLNLEYGDVTVSNFLCGVCWIDIVWQKDKHSAFHYDQLYSNYTWSITFYIIVITHILSSITSIRITESFCSHWTVVYRMVIYWKRFCKRYASSSSPVSVDKELSWRSRRCGWHRYRRSPPPSSFPSTMSCCAAPANTRAHVSLSLYLQHDVPWEHRRNAPTYRQRLWS